MKKVDEILRLHKEVEEICDLALKNTLKGKLPINSLLFLIKVRLCVGRNRKKVEKIKKKGCQLESEGKLLSADDIFLAIPEDFEELLKIAKKRLENL